MPPRSVCLNVFTSALGNGKEAGVSVREVEDRMDVDVKEEAVEERARHDSVQGSPNDSLVTSPASPGAAQKTQDVTPASTFPIAPTNIDISSLNDDIVRFNSNPNANSNPVALFCKTCGAPPAEGTSLQRCSRCKRAYYCSKVCQKYAWKTHKMDCEPASSTLNTPDISHPTSPTNTPAAMDWVETTSAPSDVVASSRQYPQSNEAWKDSNSNRGKFPVSFGAESKDILRTHLASAFYLWRSEHGAPAQPLDEPAHEWTDYLAAITERVDLPCTSEELLKDAISIQEPVTREDLLQTYPATTIEEFDRVNEAVYGCSTGP